jgi:hypothetical protein
MDPKTVEDFLKSIVNARLAIVGERKQILSDAVTRMSLEELPEGARALLRIDIYLADVDLWNAQIDLLRGKGSVK